MCVSQTAHWPTKITLQTVDVLTNHVALQIHFCWSALLDNVNMAITLENSWGVCMSCLPFNAKFKSTDFIWLITLCIFILWGRNALPL